MEILEALVEAAGGKDALAADGEWPHYRRRRIEAGILAGTVPLPSKVARAIELHRAADAAWLAANAITDNPGTWNDPAAMQEASRLLQQARELREQAGPPMTLYIGGKRISIGLGIP